MGETWLQPTIFLSGRTQLHTLEQAYCLINETRLGDAGLQIGGNLAPSGQGRISGTSSPSLALSGAGAGAVWHYLGHDGDSCLGRPARSQLLQLTNVNAQWCTQG